MRRRGRLYVGNLGAMRGASVSAAVGCSWLGGGAVVHPRRAATADVCRLRHTVAGAAVAVRQLCALGGTGTSTVRDGDAARGPYQRDALTARTVRKSSRLGRRVLAGGRGGEAGKTTAGCGEYTDPQPAARVQVQADHQGGRSSRLVSACNSSVRVLSSHSKRTCSPGYQSANVNSRMAPSMWQAARWRSVEAMIFRISHDGAVSRDGCGATGCGSPGGGCGVDCNRFA